MGRRWKASKMAIVSQETKEKILEGLEHVKVHLETSVGFGDRLAPIERALTTAGMAAIMPNKELKNRAQNIMKHHHLISKADGDFPVSDKGDSMDCYIASASGIQINGYEGIMDLRFLNVWERTVLVEFVQRFDKGEYPADAKPPEDENNERKHDKGGRD